MQSGYELRYQIRYHWPRPLFLDVLLDLVEGYAQLRRGSISTFLGTRLNRALRANFF